VADIPGVDERMAAEPIFAIELDYERLAEAIVKRLSLPMPASTMAVEEYWSTKEVARALGVHRKTIYDIVVKPGFPAASYFTKQRRWKSTDVLAWAAQQNIATNKRNAVAPRVRR
jgi:excisionase family DNA binding protein